jgi:hypothetical protein
METWPVLNRSSARPGLGVLWEIPDQDFRMLAKPCPRCGRSATVAGKGAGIEIDQYFQPLGIRWVEHLLMRFGRKTAIRLPKPYEACLDCGLVWNNLNPDELRALLQRERIAIGGKETEKVTELDW